MDEVGAELIGLALETTKIPKEIAERLAQPHLEEWEKLAEIEDAKTRRQIAEVLMETKGLDPEMAHILASIARGDPGAQIIYIPGLGNIAELLKKKL